MKFNSTLIGFVVLAFVGAGVFYARSRPSTETPASAGPPSPSAGQGDLDAALPDVTVAEGSVDLKGVRISLSLFPQPPVAFAKTRVRVRAEAGGLPVVLEGGRVSFEMTMPMGDHRYALVSGEQGWQEAEVTLPLCPSGKRRWYATVEGTAAGRPRTARFRLDLKAPE